jgi:hypothetical protein
LISDWQLKHTISDLKAMERSSFGLRHKRFAFYEYLGAVLSFYRLLRRNREARRSADRIAHLFCIPRQERTHPIRVIIDATSAADEKTKSRWARSLRYAWYGRRFWKDLNELFRSNGGPAGCAEEYAALHKRENGCPKIEPANSGQNRSPMADVPTFKPSQLYVRGNRVFRTPDVSDADNSNPVQTNEVAAREMPQRKGV